MMQSEDSETATGVAGEREGALRILLLVPSPGIQGPIPKVSPLLVEGLRREGCCVTTIPWGRSRDDDTFLRRLVGRTSVLLRTLNTVRRGHFDVLLVNTGHNVRALARDVPLVSLARLFCGCIMMLFHGSSPDRLLSPGSWGLKLGTRLLLCGADGGLVLSSEELAQWRQRFPGGAFFAVDNPFVVRRRDPATKLPPVPGLPQGGPIVLFVGRLIE